MRRVEFFFVGVVIAVCAGYILGNKLLAQGRKSEIHGSAGTRKMAALLERLAADSDAQPQGNPFGNKRRADALRLLLAKEFDADKRIGIQLTFAEELLRAGQTSESIEQLSALYQQLAQKEGAHASSNRSNVASLLGLAYLRRGEQDNCIQNHNTESCLLP